MTDEQLLHYVEIQSKTEHALFSPDDVYHLTKIVYGEKVANRIQRYTWRTLHYEDIKHELKMGWERLRKKDFEVVKSPHSDCRIIVLT